MAIALAILINVLLATIVHAQAVAPYDSLSPIEPSMADPRKLAEQLLVEKWLPAVTRSPEFYHMRGIEIKTPRLGDPFLEVRTSWR